MRTDLVPNPDSELVTVKMTDNSSRGRFHAVGL